MTYRQRSHDYLEPIAEVSYLNLELAVGIS